MVGWNGGGKGRKCAYLGGGIEVWDCRLCSDRLMHRQLELKAYSVRHPGMLLV